MATKTIPTLLHAVSLDALKNKYPDYADASSPIFKSVAFTDNGYLYTHGKIYQMALIGVDNPWQLSVTYGSGSLSVSLVNTTPQSVTLPVYDLKGDSFLSTANDNGKWTISHKTLYTIDQSAGSVGVDTIQLPIITTDLAGHIKNITSSQVNINYVLQTASTSNTAYKLLFGDGTTSGTLYDTTLFYNPSTHSLGVTNLAVSGEFTIGGSALGNLYAPLSHVNVLADASVLGHVKLSDKIDNTISGTDTVVTAGYAATPKAVYDALTAAKTYAKDILGNTSAMMFAGTVNESGVILSHNSELISTGITDGTTNISELTNYKAGWTFRVTTNTTGTISGIGVVEDGDMLISTKANSVYTASDFTVIQANLNGAVTSTATSLDGILYGTGNRTVTSLNGTSGLILQANGSGNAPTWIDPKSIYRPITIDTTSIGTSSLTMKAGSYVTLAYDNGVLTISSVDTWRPVNAFVASATDGELEAAIQTSLSFSSDFIWDNTTNDLHIGWAELAADGTVTYTI